ncbi:hypothetical protein COLO4_04290 [Corchorus olitorius]|uniref:Uncharacterized protein n=1 Tax=Corchorus olitorius TaxID=93759 RepID=A0A1R3KUJ1_9ROSI|nr:hypothetical protein COLO4_04290 [Corchorus olitorius]
MTRAFDARIQVLPSSNRLQTPDFCSTLCPSSIPWFNFRFPSLLRVCARCACFIFRKKRSKLFPLFDQRD